MEKNYLIPIPSEYIENFNEIFKEKEIKLIGINKKIYFKAKNFLKFLNYKESSFDGLLYRINKIHKANLNIILKNRDKNILHNYTKGKETYLTEEGSFNFILKSKLNKKTSVKKFFFIYLIPSLKQLIKENNTINRLNYILVLLDIDNQILSIKMKVI